MLSLMLTLAEAEVRYTRNGGMFSFLPCCCIPFVVLFTLLGTAFWIWMLIDCIRHETDEGNNKVVWILVIVLTHWVGALIYYFVRYRARPRP
jgi:hypothetical protein